MRQVIIDGGIPDLIIGTTTNPLVHRRRFLINKDRSKGFFAHGSFLLLLSMKSDTLIVDPASTPHHLDQLVLLVSGWVYPDFLGTEEFIVWLFF